MIIVQAASFDVFLFTVTLRTLIRWGCCDVDAMLITKEDRKKVVKNSLRNPSIENPFVIQQNDLYILKCYVLSMYSKMSTLSTLM